MVNPGTHHLAPLPGPQRPGATSLAARCRRHSAGADNTARWRRLTGCQALAPQRGNLEMACARARWESTLRGRGGHGRPSGVGAGGLHGPCVCGGRVGPCRRGGACDGLRRPLAWRRFLRPPRGAPGWARPPLAWVGRALYRAETFRVALALLRVSISRASPVGAFEVAPSLCALALLRRAPPFPSPLGALCGRWSVGPAAERDRHDPERCNGEPRKGAHGCACVST